MLLLSWLLSTVKKLTVVEMRHLIIPHRDLQGGSVVINVGISSGYYILTPGMNNWPPITPWTSTSAFTAQVKDFLNWMATVKNGPVQVYHLPEYWTATAKNWPTPLYRLPGYGQ